MKKLIYSMLMLAAVAFTFSSCEDVPLPYGWPSSDQKGDDGNDDDKLPKEGDGTYATPYNVAAANALIESGEYDGDANVYVKGIITEIEAGLPNTYGNATYYISDDGEGTNKLEVYRGYGYNGAKITSETDINKGDTVIVLGKLVNYSGTYEITQGSSIVYINGKSVYDAGEATGDGTLENPFNSVAANDYASSLAANAESDKDVYIKGKVVSIVSNFSTQYGNATFYISDDGTDKGQFYVFRTLYLGNQKYTSGDLVAVGDEVVICGKVTNYYGNTPETVTNKSYLYSLNGKTAGGDTPSDGAKGDGTADNPYNSVAANKYASSLAANAVSDNDVYIKGKIVSIASDFNTTYGNASYYISDDGTTANQFYVFRTYYLENKKYTEGDKPQVGDEIVVCGKVTNYYGNTPETAAGKSYIYKWTKNSGGSTETTATEIKATDFGKDNGVEVGTATLQDITFTFEKGSNANNAPKYFKAGSGNIRMYPGNKVTIDAGSKKIASIKANCDTYSGTQCTAEGLVTCDPGTATLNDVVYTFSDINSSKVTITNTNTNTGPASQFRLISLSITFAE